MLNLFINQYEKYCIIYYFCVCTVLLNFFFNNWHTLERISQQLFMKVSAVLLYRYLLEGLYFKSEICVCHLHKASSSQPIDLTPGQRRLQTRCAKNNTTLLTTKAAHREGLIDMGSLFESISQNKHVYLQRLTLKSIW